VPNTTLNPAQDHNYILHL